MRLLKLIPLSATTHILQAQQINSLVQDDYDNPRKLNCIHV